MQVKYLQFPSKRKFGVELEVDKSVPQFKLREAILAVDKRDVKCTGWAHTYGNNFWHVKTDSTCGHTGHRKDGGGFEIASHIAKGYKDVLTLGKVSKSLEENGAKVNEHCGVHIHTDVTDLDACQAGTTFAWWLKLEHIVVEAVPRHRRGNKHCKLYGGKFRSNITSASSADEFWKTVSRFKPPKKMSLNVYNYITFLNGGGFGKGTFELRLPDGTLFSDDVMNWVRFFVNFIECSRNVDFPKNGDKVARLDKALVVLGLQGKEEFYILSRGLRAAKQWFLQRIIRHSTSYAYKRQAKEALKFMSI